MSAELHKYIEKAIDKNKDLLNSEIINFPNDKNKNSKFNSHNFWKINDKSNQDQLKAVTGICFMIGSLIIMGLYSGLV